VQVDGHSAYEGEVIRGKPSGYGKLVSGNYTYEGQFVNGKKHGYIECRSFVYTAQLRYLFDKKDGLETYVHNDGTTKTSVFVEGAQQLVERFVHRDGSLEYIDVVDGYRHGNSLTWDLKRGLFYAFEFEDHDLKGKGRKYAFKEEIA